MGSLKSDELSIVFLMDLGNLFEIVVHYLLIGEMTCSGHRDGFPMASTLLYVMNTGQDLW